MSNAHSRSKQGDDRGLVSRVALGDPEAWASLVERYSGYVFSLLSSARVPEKDRADAFQYVFVELFKAIPKMEQTSYLAPWIRQTTLRHAVRLRSKAAREVGSLEDFEHVLVEEGFASEVERAEKGQLVREAVIGLSSKCQELVSSLFFKDPPEPYDIVAEKLGIKTSSLSMIRQRCLDALEKALRSRGLP